MKIYRCDKKSCRKILTDEDDSVLRYHFDVSLYSGDMSVYELGNITAFDLCPSCAKKLFEEFLQEKGE